MSIPKSFYKQNVPDQLSTAQLSKFRMETLMIDELENAINTTLSDLFSQERNDIIESEKQEIESITSADDLICVMRKHTEMMNTNLMCKKALSNQPLYMPAIVDRLERNMQDKFIERAGEMLYNADEQYLRQLADDYKNIRSPYAQAMVCLLIGMRDFKEYEDFLLSEFNNFKKLYPDKHYEQYPLLALHLMK